MLEGIKLLPKPPSQVGKCKEEEVISILGSLRELSLRKFVASSLLCFHSSGRVCTSSFVFRLSEELEENEAFFVALEAANVRGEAAALVAASGSLVSLRRSSQTSWT